MTFPVAVIATCRPGRRSFFDRFCLPSIHANRPAQLVVEEGEAVPEARKEAAARKTWMTHVAFVSDDEVLDAEFLPTLIRALRENPDAAFAHCDFAAFPWPAGTGPSSIRTSGPGTGAAWVAKRELWLAKKEAPGGRHVQGVYFMKFLAGGAP